ncbi:MAG: aminotransferase class I/II-fold pyridoxal phosphate-dependent enzyme [Clostridiales bacterium]|jgi:arginine/lysine/ornithine decarboxylase|nr:aminotransferase class I/II-fold pyridoxal phosphate-dependent enzyme [Clostridiales bacterium]
MIYQKIDAHVKDFYPFHMPGHKRRFFSTDIINHDITEMAGLDDLFSANGDIARLQNRIARMYGARHARILVNGSTAGILASINSCCGEGDEIIMSRGSHISAFNALALSGAKPVYIYPTLSALGYLEQPGQRVLDTILQHPNCKCVYITSPTYEGFCADVYSIANIAHKNGKLLIVDEAHGAHFGFDKIFPLNAIRLGADIVIDGLHKTMPALGQTAVIHVGNDNVDTDRLDFFLRAIQTSSPSYIFLSALDYAFSTILADSTYFERYAALLSQARGQIQLLNKISLLETDDPSKLMLIPPVNYSGDELYKFLWDRGLAIEMSRPCYALAMTSVCDTREGFEWLTDALAKADESFSLMRQHELPSVSNMADYEFSEQMMTPREAIASKSAYVDINDVVGRVSADHFVQYPPGIPLVVPGERISENCARTMKGAGISRFRVVTDQ